MPAQQPDRRELKRQLLVDLDRARLAVVVHSEETVRQLSPAAMVERSFQKHRVVWIAGAAVAGVVALRFLFSPRAPKIERDNFLKSGTKAGLFRLLAAPLLNVGKKAAVDFATQYFKNRFKQPFPTSDRESDVI